MKVQFTCKVIPAEISFTPTKPKITESANKVQFPATIASISRGGLVDVRFYLSILVPNNTNRNNQSYNENDKRQLKQIDDMLSPEHLITKDVL
jgi:hypothetical protein